MSLLQEIHNQRPVVRHTLFLLSTVAAISAVAFLTVSSLQKDIYFGMHPDPVDRQAFLASRDASRPQPVAAIARAADSLVASIGSLIGWNSSAGFDRSTQQDDTQGGVHLLPVSE